MTASDLDVLSMVSWISSSNFDLGLTIAEIEEGLRQGLTPAAKYRRISDDREGRELGITRQENHLDEVAARDGLIYVASYCDNDISASTRTRRRRPEYQQMIKDAKAGHFKVIAAATTNRLTRKHIEFNRQIELAEQHGIVYAYHKSPQFDLNTAQGRLMARVLADFDAAEPEFISERVTDARVHQAKTGTFGGGHRFGFGAQKVDQLGNPMLDDDGEPMLDWAAWVPELAAEIAKACHAVLAGTSSRSIMRDWDARGIKPLRGESWGYRSFNQLMLRPSNAGLMVYKGEVQEGVEAPWPAIITRETWEALKVKLSDASRKKSPGNKPRNLLSGIMRCGHPVCADDPKADMRLGRRAGTDRNPYPAYRCRVKGHNWIKAEEVETHVQEVILRWLEDPRSADVMAPVDETRSAELAIRANGLRERLEGTKRMFVDGILTEAEMREMRGELTEQLSVVEKAQADMAGVTPLHDLAGKPDARARWKTLDLGRKQAVIKLLLRITIMSSTRRGGTLGKGQYFDYSRIVIEPTEHMKGA